MVEQRQHARLAVEMVLFDTSAGTYVAVATRNVSAGGAFLVISTLPPIGSELRLAVTRRGDGSRSRVRELIEGRGVVTRHGEDGVGIAFVEPSEELLRALALAGAGDSKP